MPYHLKSMFKRYSDIKFGRNENEYNPFTLGQRNNGKMDFFRRLFTHSGKEDMFSEYTQGLSKLQQLSVENEFLHPMKYASIMRSIEGEVNNVMKKTFASTIDVDTGNIYPIPSHNFSNNPVYAMLGAGLSTNYGYQINTAKRFTGYQKNMLKRLFDQGNQFLESKSDSWDALKKQAKIQGKC